MNTRQKREAANPDARFKHKAPSLLDAILFPAL